MKHLYDFPADKLAALQKEFEDELVAKNAEQWADGTFFAKSSENMYTYHMTDGLWYQFLERKRSWPEDENEHGENMYQNTCQAESCKQMFYGHKRRTICRMCATDIAEGNKPKFNDPKQVLIVPKDLEISTGKMFAQVAHASVAAILNLGRLVLADCKQDHAFDFCIPITGDEQGNALLHWMTKSFPKIALECKAKDLKKYYDQAVEAGLPCSYIVDSGRTEFGGVPTPTCVAIGPAPREEIDKITKRLRVYSRGL